MAEGSGTPDSHRYLVVGALALVAAAALVIWTEVLSCPDCAGRLVAAAAYAKPGSHVRVEFAYRESNTFSNRPVLQIAAVTPAVPVFVAISDAKACESRGAGRTLRPRESFSESQLMGPAVTSDAGATKSRSNGLTGIISEIKLTPIRLYYIQPDDLPVDCALGADATPVYFEARRLRFLHWLSLPTKYVEELESAESDTFYLDQPDAQDVRIDDTTGSFKGTKPSINTLRNQIKQSEGIPRSLVAEEERENAVLTLEWSTRQRGHWHELLLFIAAALVGVGATCLVEGLRWWFAGRARPA